MPRNPRWIPGVGDRLLKGSLQGVLEREVLAVTGGQVEFFTKGKKYTTTLQRWRTWACDANLARVCLGRA